MKINGKEITAKPLDFNAIVTIQDMGADIFAFGKRPLSVLRAYLAYCTDSDLETAGREIESHVISGGDLTEFSKAFIDVCGESGFFKAMVARAENNKSESETATKA